MENANPSCSTSNREFLDPKKKKEIESWLEDSRTVDLLDVLNEIEYFDTFPTLEELEYHEWILKYLKPSWIMTYRLRSRQKPSNPNKISNFVGRVRGLRIFIGSFTNECDFMILEDTTSIINRHLGEMVFGRPFIDETCLDYNEEEGTVMFKQDDEKITFKMPHTMEIFKQTRRMGLSTDSIPPSAYEENFGHRRTHYYQSLLIGDEYKQDEGDRRGIRDLIRKFFIKNKNFIFTERGDGVTIYTRRRHHDICDGVRISLTASNAQVIFDEKKLGNLEDEATPSGEQSSPPVPKTAKQLAARRNQEKDLEASCS
ncbi:hypothetical protein Tco_0459768 [Tanacetum coccineum]